MKKALIIVMAVAMMFAFCACGETEEEPTSYTPTDIQVEEADGANVYSVIYDIDNSDTDVWSGYDTDELCKNTAIEGIKACMDRDDWADGSVVFGYAKEPKLKNMLYSYGMDGDYSGISMYQIGIYNDTYTLQGEFDK